MGMIWTLTQIDENTWDRAVYLYCSPWSRWKAGSYTLVRVIDPSGMKLPLFDDMVRSCGQKVGGYPRKPNMQIMNCDSAQHCKQSIDKLDLESGVKETSIIGKSFV